MLNVKITGLDKIKRQLDEVQRALKVLHGTITTLKFDPADPKSVEVAIRQMEAAVDEKTAPYRSNELVSKLAQASKDKFREQILERASARKGS